MHKTIGLKVDVDTFEGMKHGVPRLLALFEKYHVRASFFVPMGKDHTGWTIKRVFTRPGFVSKAQRVGVLETYGVKTLMRGLLLPGPEIARGHRKLLHEIRARGHELGIHGLDHVYWHDHIKHMDREKTEKTLRKAVDVYQEIVGEKPRSFAAPGWMINSHALAFFEEQGFIHSSDTRGETPFFPRMGGRTFNVIQLPSTLPTLDEMVGLEGNDQKSLASYFARCLKDGINVISVHTELEGNRWTAFLASFIEQSLDRTYRFERLADIASGLKPEADIPVCDCIYGQVRGRAGEVTLQGPPVRG
ncbi:MAG: putative 4-deoxy-4-formamido-L-arabinose-phosphoundecaprenol deformylase ArnD [Syntrophorhabdaceae bacterium PtaU1.Bin034]|nr:MAG: putative 4-deoxy-4-formamido-L-arabinose-phosphoundecaprenol deformylase ArnD [Syntrophorhabdaceae bacterium PtaU1.Bin034]